MQTKESTKEKARIKAQEVKGFIEGLELQLSLGKADALDEFEKQKKNFKKFITETIETVTGPEFGNNFKAQLEELLLQLSLGKAETRDAFEEQKENISNAIKIIKEGNEEFKNVIKEKYPQFFEYDKKVDQFRTHIDMARLQFVLGKAELKEEIERDKTIFLKNLKGFKSILENEIEVAEDKLDDIRDEVIIAFEAFKTGLKKKNN
jgi:hypothetical protein